MEWPRSRSGIYLVKTGYQILYELENREGASNSTSTAPNRFWNGIWKLKILNKIRIFYWWACFEAVPMLKNLHRQKILNSPLCSACEKLEESILRVLWECDKIRSIWGPKFNDLWHDYPHLGSFSDLVSLVRYSKKIWNSSWWWHGLYSIGETNADSKSLVSLLRRFSRQRRTYWLSFERNHLPNLVLQDLFARGGNPQRLIYTKLIMVGLCSQR